MTLPAPRASVFVTFTQDEPSEAPSDPCGAGEAPFCRGILERTDSETLAILAGRVTPAVLQILVIVVAAVILIKLSNRVIKRMTDRMADTDRMERFRTWRQQAPLSESTRRDIQRAARRAETVGNTLRSTVKVIIWLVAALMSLGAIGFGTEELGPLIASAGVLGVALGFGAQSLVRDFLTGTFMLVEDHFGVGDIIDAGPAVGTVEGISLRTTRLRDLSGTVWHIPNGEISRVGNMSQLWSRSLIDVGVAYDTDTNHAIGVIDRVGHELWHEEEWSETILEEPEVWGVVELGDSAVTLRMVIKTVPAKQWMVERELRARLKAAFDAEGIEIPFPQRVVWTPGEDEDGGAGHGHRTLGKTARGSRREEPPEHADSGVDAAQ